MSSLFGGTLTNTNTANIQIIGLGRIERRLARFGRTLYSRQMLHEIGQFGMTAIKVRTVQGKDVNGGPFKPYSESYKLFRKTAGRPTNKVDLTFTGSMLSSMTYDVGDKFVRIYFLNTATDSYSSIRNPQKAFFLNEDRKFFALSKTDMKRIRSIVRRFIRLELSKTK